MRSHKPFAAYLRPAANLTFWLFSSIVHADIAADLKACFDEPNIEKSKKCLTDLRENDAINRPQPPSVAKQIAGTVTAPAVFSDKVKEQGREVRQVMKANLEPSYATVGSGVHAGGDRTTTAMLYEAQVFQNLECSNGRSPEVRISASIFGSMFPFGSVCGNCRSIPIRSGHLRSAPACVCSWYPMTEISRKMVPGT